MAFDELVHIEVGGAIDQHSGKPIRVEPFEEIVPMERLSTLPLVSDLVLEDDTCLNNSVRLTWRGGIFDPTGYASEGRAFLLPLSRRLRHIRAENVVWISRQTPLPEREYRILDRLLTTVITAPYIEVVDLPPPYFECGGESGVYRIGRTMYEAVGLHRYWVERCNMMDEIWVPSRFCEEIFTQSGVRVPVRIVPGPVDRQVFYQAEKHRSPVFRFLSVFTFTSRKGWETLLEAYCREFNRDEQVELVLRIFHPARPLTEIVSEIAAKIENLGLPSDRLPVIKILEEGILSQCRMRDLYHSADVLVAPSCGEGYGRPLLEALSCGTPVITTGWGGQTDFVSNENGWLIDYDLVVSDVGNDITFQPFNGGVWAKAQVDHLRVLMREASTSYSEWRRRSLTASFSIERYDAETVADQVVEKLIEISDRISCATTRTPKPILMITSPRSHCETRQHSESLMRYGLREKASLLGFPYGGFNNLPSAHLIHLQYHPSYCDCRKILSNIPDGILVASVHDVSGFERVSEVFDLITVFSERDRRAIFGFPLKEGARVVVLQHGCPTPQSKAGVHSTDPVIGFYGFWGERKGIKELVIGFRKFLDSGYSHARLRLFAFIDAYDPDGGLYWSSEFRRLIGSLGIAEQVDIEEEFLPEEEMVVNLAAGTDMVFLPYTQSNASGVSGMVKTAMAAMVPIIVGNTHIFDDVGEAVIRMETITSDGCADMMRYVWENRILQQYIVARARKRVEEEAYPKVVQRMLELYDEVSENRELYESDRLRVKENG